ncbi:MAG: serine/threonine protein kinase [Labilithrix sp.]|nr:serine/threonine protein kinase [Labilithrix sp.]MBX3223584.1 serine/threonine protein kinase [Labilithrix sp.]
MAALSRTNLDGGPGPLEGLHPDVLLKGVSAALHDGLADDLDWLSPQAAGVALYTLAAALPVGVEQRELGRRVLARMIAGDAETFTAIATSMAQSAGKGLGSPNVRARIALVAELPLAHAIADGPLALALVSRREFQRDWVSVPSTRSLPARRLVAKILERAAREAARRAQMGDTHALRVFAGETVRAAYNRLLADRESLVWRYVAVARGLCAGWIPELKQQIQESLREGLSPTEWRRAAASLAAFGAVRPDDALKITAAVVKRGLFTWEDPPSAAAFIWGIPRTIEAEPEAATKLLDLVLPVASAEVAEAVCELRYEYGPSKVVDRAQRQAYELLKATREKPKGEDDGADALYHEIARDLEPGPRDDQPVRGQAAAALDAFVTEGAVAAYMRAREVLVAARGGMDALEAVANDDHADGRTGSLARRTSMAVMRDLDTSLLERPVVADLLKLGGSTEARASEEGLDAIRERFAEWIVTCESPEEIAAEAEVPAPRHATLRLRRLRTLLHLVDGDLGEGLEASAGGRAAQDGDAARAKRLRTLWLRTVKALLRHFERDPAPVLKRTLLASLARALDALVRLGVCDVADALLVLAMRIRGRRDFDALAEASMDPDLRHVLARYARFLRESEPTLEVSAQAESARPPQKKAVEERLKALEALADELAPEGSARSEALRTVLVRIHGALAATVKVTALCALSTSNTTDADVVASVETWVGALAQMCLGARGRLDPDVPVAAPPVAQPKLLSVLVSRVLAEAETPLDEQDLGAAVNELVGGIPHGLGRLVSGLLWGLADLPVERPSAEAGILSVAEQLPPWLPARRTIGGFYVQRSLGVGGTASVFIVTRAEDKHEPSAERFALKVPDYNATAARSLSQEEFLALFREEASALIMLPNHANLARFVTFDMGTRPLPILVMELVEGVTLERVLQSRTFDVKKCLKVLDDVLAGLEAMHSVGLGHLDLKPSNVLLRRGEQGVLVDFGLAGRKLRQGCGTGPYGAPEVWGVLPEGFVPSPAAADIYSFGCLAFEMLTGKVLFDASNEVAQITMHVSHDGFPAPMKELLANPEVSPVAEVLVPTLRRDPRNRPTAEELRRDLRATWSLVETAKWPAPVTATA